MKKYIRVCDCCGNTYETDIPEFECFEDGSLNRTTASAFCKSCYEDYTKGKIFIENIDIEQPLYPFRIYIQRYKCIKIPRPQG